MAKGFRLLLFVLAGMCVTLGIGFGFRDHLPWVWNPVGVGFACVLLVGALKPKIEIYSDRIRKVDLSGSRELLFSDIAGFKNVSVAYLSKPILVSRDKTAKRLKIEFSIERPFEFREWLSQNFADLDKERVQYELDEIYRNPALQGNPKEKAVRLNWARKTCALLNLAAFGCSYWLFVNPHPLKAAILTGALFPLAGLILAISFPGLVRLNGPIKSAFGSIGFAYFGPTICLSIRAFMDWYILDWSRFWLPFAAITAGFFLAHILLARRSINRAGIIMLCICAPLYGYGAGICLNGILSDSQPTLQGVRVMDMYMTKDRPPEYHLIISPWEPRKYPTDFPVSRPVYQRHKVGDAATVEVHIGKFGIPFYFAF